MFSRGARVDFSKRFSGVSKSDEICFLPVETKKTAIFLKISPLKTGLISSVLYHYK